MLTMKQRSVLGNEAQRILNQECAEGYRWFLQPLASGSLSLRQLADTMNAYRISTPTGKGRWYKMTVSRTLRRLGLYGQVAV